MGCTSGQCGSLVSLGKEEDTVTRYSMDEPGGHQAK